MKIKRNKAEDLKTLIEVRHYIQEARLKLKSVYPCVENLFDYDVKLLSKMINNINISFTHDKTGR